MLRKATCRTCGIEFIGGPRAWYCPNCRYERQLERGRENNVRRRAKKTRALGSTDLCVRCGKAYTVQNGLQKYCTDCRPDAYRETERKIGLKYYHENKEVINPIRNEKRHRPPAVCAVCGRMYERHTRKATCSEECAKDLLKQWQHRADKKRSPRRIKKAED